MRRLRCLPGLWGAALGFALISSGCGGGGESLSALDELDTKVAEQVAAAASLEVTSSVFTENERIPDEYSCYGEGKSPDLKWSGAPQGTESIAIIVDDPDALRGRATRVQWVAYGLSPDVRGLLEGAPGANILPPGASHGSNDFEGTGYAAPCPPRSVLRGGGLRTKYAPERYFFKVYALDTEVQLGPGAGKEELLRAMDGHILGAGQLMGRYQASPAQAPTNVEDTGYFAR